MASSPSNASVVAARFDLLRRWSWTAITTMVVPFVVGAAADLCVLAGVALIAYGFGLVWRPVAFIFLGLVCIAIGLRGIQKPPAPTGAGE